MQQTLMHVDVPNSDTALPIVFQKRRPRSDLGHWHRSCRGSLLLLLLLDGGSGGSGVAWLLLLLWEVMVMVASHECGASLKTAASEVGRGVVGGELKQGGIPAQRIGCGGAAAIAAAAAAHPAGKSGVGGS